MWRTLRTIHRSTTITRMGVVRLFTCFHILWHWTGTRTHKSLTTWSRMRTLLVITRCSCIIL
ncbi:unnamed protein product [Larinioides sclopetarius]|uniref:Uncharacterized protein n=1 Tax=Larinioides sclopetarius TaxID=280406 RepID=A0AAV1ZZV8_9ARAC